MLLGAPASAEKTPAAQRRVGIPVPGMVPMQLDGLPGFQIEKGLAARADAHDAASSVGTKDEKKEKRIRDHLNKYISSAKALLNGETTRAKLHLLWNEDAREHRIKCMLATEVPKLVAILKQL